MEWQQRISLDPGICRRAMCRLQQDTLEAGVL